MSRALGYVTGAFVALAIWAVLIALAAPPIFFLIRWWFGYWTRFWGLE